MRETAFVAREEELSLLTEMWNASRATLIILYGRRRVGKTRLLTHWLKTHADHGLYWVAEPTSAHDQLRSFSQAIYNFSIPEGAPLAPREFSYANWEQAFQQVAIMAQSSRFALFIDEFTYLMNTTSKIVGTLQKVWDHSLSKTNIMLALSGSQMGMMQQEMLSYDAPLYGRTTAQIQLPQLPYGVTKRFFEEYDARQRVSLYSVWGGIPAYWEHINPERTIMENIRSHLLPSNGQMQEEPRLLLQDFVNDPYNYVGIMRAIAQGARTQATIASQVGLPKSHIPRYVKVLRETGFVEREVPVTEATTKSRRGRYFITDVYLRFYYHFLSQFQSKLALGEQQEVQQEIEANLPQFIQDNSWQELCREWVLRASANGELEMPVKEVGSLWMRTHIFDVAGIDRDSKTLVLGGCLWNSAPADIGEFRDLLTRTPHVVPDDGAWTVHYLLFSASGWTPHAYEQAPALLKKRTKRGANWQPASVQLLDLERIDNDLVRWTSSYLQ